MQNTFNEGARDITPNDEGVREISCEEGFGNGISPDPIIIIEKDEGIGNGIQAKVGPKVY